MFQYNVPNIVFHLNFVGYENVITGEDYRLEVVKIEELGYFDYTLKNQDYEYAEELEYHKDIIEMRKNNLINLENQLAKLTA